MQTYFEASAISGLSHRQVNPKLRNDSQSEIELERYIKALVVFRHPQILPTDCADYFDVFFDMWEIPQ